MPLDDVRQIEPDINVNSIYSSEVMEPALNKSALTVKANVAWSNGYTGCCEEYFNYFPKIAVVDRTGVDEDHTYLGTIEYFDPNNKNEGDSDTCHATWVMGVIA
ncbi:MAG: hypothetical protein AB1611_21285 [bacterium]